MSKFASAFVNVTGRKDFPFAAMLTSGICLGYFKRSDDAGKCCAEYLANKAEAQS